MTGYYQKLTSEVTFDAAIDDLTEIEAIMRDEAGGTLDHLGPTEFAELARDLRVVNDAIRGM